MKVITNKSPWQLGNTTVRNPLRIPSGLKALADSTLEGRIRGSAQREKAFIKLLAGAGVVTPSEEREDSTYSVGRKWRSALDGLGFLVPEIPTSSSALQVGEVDFITENGRRLVEADTVFAMQDCFLRALVAYTLPNPSEKKFAYYKPFSPIVHVIQVMLKLEQLGGENHLTFNEIASYVQMSGGGDDLDKLAHEILERRTERLQANNKKAFDKTLREKAATNATCNADSLKDYADMNIRYLKASGVFQAKGRGISILPERKALAEKIVSQYSPPADDTVYYQVLCKGAALPTDDKDTAKELVQNLVTQLKERDIEVDLTGRPQEQVADIDALRYSLEELLFADKEEKFASLQRSNWEEISCYLELLINRSSKTVELPNGEEIKVPKDEAPAYFEWVIWRAFLAINDLRCKPQEARGFKIDQDFLPINTAVGGKPDLLFIFDDYVLVVEVTFTTNSRQEAAEGEPVRRHVADILEQYSGKIPVYGLFLANSIDSNTAETFRIGSWYNKDDTRLKLDITPLTLSSFKNYFDAMMRSPDISNKKIKQLLEECNAPREELHGPQWRAKIEEIILQSASELLSI